MVKLGGGRGFGGPRELEEHVKGIWSNIKDDIHSRLINGKATCTLATYEVGRSLKREGYVVQIVDGEYKGWGHWYPVVSVGEKRYIVDLGNNIDAINTGRIKPKIVSYPHKDYSADTTMTVKEYNYFYLSIKDL